MATVRLSTAFNLTRKTSYDLVEFDDRRPYIDYEDGIRLTVLSGGFDIVTGLTLTQNSKPMVSFSGFRLYTGDWADTHVYAGNLLPFTRAIMRGEDDVTGSTGRDTINGFGGADQIDGRGGDDRLFGAAGNDRLQGGAGNDRLSGGTGRDVLDGGSGADRLNGDADNDRLAGGRGNDILNGGSGADRLNGGKGSDQLIGGRGNDILTGGSNRDTFVFAKGNGSDRITDFKPGMDRIKFQSGPDAMNDLRISETGDDTVIRYGSNRIVLDDISPDQLGADTFIFI